MDHEQQAREMPPFDDPRVRQVYEILCEDSAAPDGEHWEGFAARRIVAALIAREERMRKALRSARAVVAHLYEHDQIVADPCLAAIDAALAPIAAEPAQPAGVGHAYSCTYGMLEDDEGAKSPCNCGAQPAPVAQPVQTLCGYPSCDCERAPPAPPCPRGLPENGDIDATIARLTAEVDALREDAERPAEVRMDGDLLDEVVGRGEFQLEQMADNVWFVLLGDVAVFLRARGAIKATFERRDSARKAPATPTGSGS